MPKDTCIKILEDAAVPSAHLLDYGDLFWHQDDGAPCHRAKIVNAWKEENGYRYLQWPPQSPDLNPILYGVTLSGTFAPADLAILETNVMSAWREIPASWCQELVR